MTPGKYNFICPQGATFSKQLTWTIDENPVDLTTYSARMQVREKHSSTSTIVSLTSDAGDITLGGANGTILIEIPASVTEDFIAKDYVYDLELIVTSNVTRLLEGKFIVTPEVTR
jgi:hypothetical protein